MNLDKSDDMLIDDIRNGQRESFDELMQRHQHNVYHIAYNFTQTTEDAMDLLQNIFLKAYQNLHKFRGESLFKTWLMRITYNEGQNWLKRNRKHDMQVALSVNDSLPAATPTQEDDFLVSEHKTQLLRCLYELNTKYRLAVVLRYFENFSTREIAETLNCSEGVVKNMLFRSIQKLKSSLKKLEAEVKQ
jgi:RNA polymerase sigma-70 factor (ECF subfamily)